MRSTRSSGSKRTRRGDRRPGHALERGYHLADAHGQAWQDQVAVRAQRVAGQLVRCDEALDDRRRRQQPHLCAGRDRADRIQAVERLADDATGEGRQRGIGPARAHTDRGQPQRPAVDEAAPRVVVDEQLAHRLLRSVRRLRRQRGGLGHDVRQGAAVDRTAAGEDESRLMPAGATDLEQQAGAVEIDPHPEIEIGLRLAAHHRREVKHRGRAGVDEPIEKRAIGDVAGVRRDARVVDRRRRNDIEQQEPIDRLRAAAGPGERPAFEQP